MIKEIHENLNIKTFSILKTWGSIACGKFILIILVEICNILIASLLFIPPALPVHVSPAGLTESQIAEAKRLYDKKNGSSMLKKLWITASKTFGKNSNGKKQITIKRCNAQEFF